MSEDTEFSVPIEFEDDHPQSDITLDDVVRYAWLWVTEYEGGTGREAFAGQVKKLIDHERDKAFKSGLTYAANIIDQEREQVTLEW